MEESASEQDRGYRCWLMRRDASMLHGEAHGTRHTSHVTRHTSHVTRHTSHVTRHTSHVTRHQVPQQRPGALSHMSWIW